MTHADCPFGTVCEDRLCRTQRPECTRDSECPPGTLCFDGACLVDPNSALECITPDDCASGLDCVNNRCSAPGDDAGGGDTIDGDATAPDSSDDADDDAGDDAGASDADDPDAADAGTDTACVFNADCPAGELCQDGRCAVPGGDAGQADADAPDADPCGAYLDDCTAASACCSGLCVPDFAGASSGFCTIDCASWGACNPTGTDGSRACLPVDDGGRTRNVCVASDWERPCASAGACLGGICLRTAGSSSCSWSCGDSADCPDGAACGLVAFAGGVVERVCTPIGNPCLTQEQCLSGTCLTDDGGGLGYCSTFCDPRAAVPCPAGYGCVAPDPLEPDLTVCVLP